MITVLLLLLTFTYRTYPFRLVGRLSFEQRQTYANRISFIHINIFRITLGTSWRLKITQVPVRAGGVEAEGREGRLGARLQLIEIMKF